MSDFKKFLFSPDKITLPAETEMSRRFLQIMQQWIPIAVANFQDWPVRPNCGHFFGGVFWYGQETSGTLNLLASVLCSPNYDEKITGISRDALREMAIKALRFLCFTHDTGPADCVRPAKGIGRPEPANTKWGERGRGFFPESQCGFSISNINIAVALLREFLDDETLEMIYNINLDYLTRFENMPPRSGVFHDTQTEENAWTALGLSSAALMLRNHPKYETWLAHAKKWMFCSSTLPRDHYNHGHFADGKSVSDWCNRTFTTLPDGLAENHAIVHPSYLGSSILFLGINANNFLLFGETPPPQLFWHRQDVYDLIKITSDLTGRAHAVQGMDWPYFAFAQECFRHSAANLFLQDADAAFLEQATLETIDTLLHVNQGHWIDPEVAAICHEVQDPAIVWEHRSTIIACSYLSHRLVQQTQPPVTAAEFQQHTAGIRHFPQGGILFHKHARGQVSFSWRNQTMVLPAPLDGSFFTGAAMGSLLAQISVKDHPASDTPRKLRVIEMPQFAGVLFIEDLAQESIRRHLLFVALPEGDSLIAEKIVARKDIEVDSFNQGFLHVITEKFACPLENDRPRRILYFPTGQKAFFGYPTANPNDNEYFYLNQPGWLNVDDKMTFHFRGSYETAWLNRHHYGVWHALADELYLSRLPDSARFRAGETVGELVTLICPEQKHTAIALGALQIARSPEALVGVLTGNYLSWAKWEEASNPTELRFDRIPGQAISVFPGSSRVTSSEFIFYPDNHDLQIIPAVAKIFIKPESRLENLLLESLPTGVVWCTNPGKELIKFSVVTGTTTKPVQISAGESFAIRP